VDDHNHFRRMHGAADVTWDEDLAKKAKTWADKMDRTNGMGHSDCYGTWPVSGENVAQGYGACSTSGDGGPELYNGNYDQHCAVASWYSEYYLWRGSGDWKNTPGVGHFTAMVWKGIDAIGCASAGNYYVCEYGSKYCRAKGKDFGGPQCWSSTPSHLPNFNQGQCSGGVCVAAKFDSMLPLTGEGLVASTGVGATAHVFAAAVAVSLSVMAVLAVVVRFRRRSIGEGLAREPETDELGQQTFLSVALNVE